jgi:hypothetical protein
MSLEKQLAAYALAGGVAVLATQGSAEASIVYSGVQNLSLQPLGGPYAAVSIDFDFDTFSDAAFLAAFGTSKFTISLVSNYTTRVVADASTLTLLPDGPYTKNVATVLPGATLVGPTAPGGGSWVNAASSSDPTKAGLQDYDNTSGASLISGWAGVTRKFIGLEVDLDNSRTSPDLHYAWIRVSVVSDLSTATLPTCLVIHDWAYETQTGVGILTGAGAVPEPGTLQVVALGGAGLVAWRRRRLQAESAVTEAC